jgi:hypothetical protein
VGAPADEQLNVDASCNACAPLEFVNLTDGTCNACPSGSVPVALGGTASTPAPGTGARCEICPAGSVPTLANTCNPCAANEITVGGVCTACGVGLHPDVSATQCIACSIDEVVDWQPIGDAECNHTKTLSVAPDSGEGDTCPDQHVVKFENMGAEAALGVSASAGLDSIVDGPSCSATSAEGEAFQLNSDGSFTPLASLPFETGVGSECTPTEEAPFCFTCDLDVNELVTGSQLSAAGDQLVLAVRVTGPALSDADMHVSSMRTRPPSCGPF